MDILLSSLLIVQLKFNSRTLQVRSKCWRLIIDCGILACTCDDPKCSTCTSHGTDYLLDLTIGVLKTAQGEEVRVAPSVTAQ